MRNNLFSAVMLFGLSVFLCGCSDSEKDDMLINALVEQGKNYENTSSDSGQEIATEEIENANVREEELLQTQQEASQTMQNSGEENEVNGQKNGEDVVVEENAIENEESAEEKSTQAYNKENLENGFYIIDGDLFWKIDTENGLPNGFQYADGKALIYTDAELYNKDMLPTISMDTVFAVKGSGEHDIWFHRIDFYGYTYNCDFNSVGINEYGRVLGDELDFIWEDDVRKINDIEMSVDDFIDEKLNEGMFMGYGWTSIDDMLIGDESFLNDTFKVGYFDKTDFKEKEFDISFWVAGGEADHSRGTLEWTETYDGYFELRFPEQVEYFYDYFDLVPGLYVIKFNGNGYYTWVE